MTDEEMKNVETYLIKLETTQYQLRDMLEAFKDDFYHFIRLVDDKLDNVLFEATYSTTESEEIMVKDAITTPDTEDKAKIVLTLSLAELRVLIVCCYNQQALLQSYRPEALELFKTFTQIVQGLERLYPQFATSLTTNPFNPKKG